MTWNGHDTSIRNKTLTHMAWNTEDIELFRLKLLDSLFDIFCLPRRDHYCRTLAGVCVCVCVCVCVWLRERERERERGRGECAIGSQ
jgi:hypothetical protein